MKKTRFLAFLMTLCLLTGLAVAEGCAICGGDGRCDRCGGSHYYYATEYVWQGLLGDGYELETFSKLCDYEYCVGGGCSMCDSTGWEQ